MTGFRTQLNRFLRILANSPISTPITLLQSQTGIPPVEILMTRTVASNIARMMTNPDCSLEDTYSSWRGEGWNTTPLHVYHKLRKTIKVPEKSEVGGHARLNAETMTIFKKLQFHVPPDIKTAVALHKRHQLVQTYDISIWTDGSVKYDHGASASAGWIYTYQDIIKTGNTRVFPPLSSYHAESVGMTMGLEQLRTDSDIQLTNSSIGIFTDSHGLCDHLRKYGSKIYL